MREPDIFGNQIRVGTRVPYDQRGGGGRTLEHVDFALTPRDQNTDHQAGSGGYSHCLPRLGSNVAVPRLHRAVRLSFEVTRSVREGRFRARQATLDLGPKSGDFRIGDVRQPAQQILNVGHQIRHLFAAGFTTLSRRIGRIRFMRLDLAANGLAVVVKCCFHEPFTPMNLQ